MRAQEAVTPNSNKAFSHTTTFLRRFAVASKEMTRWSPVGNRTNVDTSSFASEFSNPFQKGFNGLYLCLLLSVSQVLRREKQ